MDEGWIKLFRKFTDWEWYTDSNVKAVFLDLLLTANYYDNRWRGIEIKKGQRLTSIKALSENLKLTPRQIRTALNKLKSTNEITIKTTNKYSLITIVKYNDYQVDNFENDKRNDKQCDKRATNK